jgi:hypothetical protein
MKLNAKDCGIFIVDPTKPRPIADEEKQEKGYITKLRKFDTSCTNEIKVTSVLKERKREKKFFHLFEKIKRVQFMNKIYKNAEDYHVIMMYPSLDDNFVGFDTFFSNTNISRRYKYNIINSFKKLLRAMLVLEEERIVYPRITVDCIHIDNLTGDILLGNLNKTLLMKEDNNDERKSNSIQGLDLNGYTIEQKLLGFMNENERASLSVRDIEEVILSWLGAEFSSLSPENKHIFDELRVGFLSLVNQTREVIIGRILEMSNTWNSYGLCVLYYYFTREKMDGSGGSDVFFCGFSRFLKEKIEESPSQRSSLQKLMVDFDTFIYGLKREQW